MTPAGSIDDPTWSITELAQEHDVTLRTLRHSPIANPNPFEGSRLSKIFPGAFQFSGRLRHASASTSRAVLWSFCSSK